MTRSAPLVVAAILASASTAIASGSPAPSAPPPSDAPAEPVPVPTPAPVAAPLAEPAPTAPTAPTPSPESAEPEAAPTSGATVQQQQVVVMGGLPHRCGVSWDATISLGLRVWRNEDATAPWGLARARAGVLLYSGPLFAIIGAAGQVGGLGRYGAGVEAQLIHMELGFWGQLGVYPLRAESGMSLGASLGYTLFGVEYQRETAGEREGDQALLLTVHLPIGVVLTALSGR